jgi:Arc/MetJ family transcription regulator
MESNMRTNIELDDKQVAKAMKLTGIKTKKAVMEAALDSLIKYHERLKIKDYFGKLPMDPDYDYKSMR